MLRHPPTAPSRQPAKQEPRRALACARGRAGGGLRLEPFQLAAAVAAGRGEREREKKTEGGAIRSESQGRMQRRTAPLSRPRKCSECTSVGRKALSGRRLSSQRQTNRRAASPTGSPATGAPPGRPPLPAACAPPAQGGPSNKGVRCVQHCWMVCGAYSSRSLLRRAPSSGRSQDASQQGQRGNMAAPQSATTACHATTARPAHLHLVLRHAQVLCGLLQLPLRLLRMG